MLELPPTSSSLSISSGFGNQFLKLSYDISLIGTVKDFAYVEINSLSDIQIQQEVPQIQSPTLLNIHVSIILEQLVPAPSPTLTTETFVSMVLSRPPFVTTITHVQQQTTPIPTPPITTVAPCVITVVPDPLPAIIQRLFVLESQFEAWKQVDHFEASENSVQANIINEVKNQLSKFLLAVVFDLVNPRLDIIVRDALQKKQIVLTLSSAQPAYRAAESLSKLELKNILFAKMDKS
ncbi:hypothetical protein Tco_0843251 [Tanacetum coccineum]|uniref:Uncharacterized protein n=1 Tax=Tanacetum coccineum TaxID=301880 RepID=A0ABQ5B5X6_9ASTR